MTKRKGVKMASEKVITNKPYREKILRLMPIILMVVVTVSFSLLTPFFLTIRNMQNLSQHMAILLICGIGETFVIILGCIDLSVAGVLTLSAIVSATTLPFVGGFLAIIVGISVGALCGFINGLAYQFFKIPSLIVTLAMSTISLGVALITSDAQPVRAYVDSYRYIAKNEILGIPVIWIVAAIILGLSYLVGKYTSLGRYTYAIGGKEDVVNLFRIPVRKTKILIFTLAGLLYGLGGVLLAGRIGQASNTFGTGWELDTITAVVLGGTAVSGGVGGVHRTFIGVFIVMALANGLNLMGVSPYLQTTIKGFVLIGAVVMTLDRAKLQIIK